MDNAANPFYGLALDMENRIIEIYKDLARRCVTHEGIRNILLMLIRDQERHVRVLSGMRDRRDIRIPDPEVFRAARKTFETMQAQRDAFSCDMDQTRVYRQAHKLLHEKLVFYREAGEREESSEIKRNLENLAREEEKQALVLENIIAMIDRPRQWIEDAEFNHLDEY